MLIETPAIYDAHGAYLRSIRRYALHSQQGHTLLTPTTADIVDKLTALADIVRTDYLTSSLDHWTIQGTNYRLFRLADSLHGLSEGREGLISPLSSDPPPTTAVMTTALIPFVNFVEEKIHDEGGIGQLTALGNAMFDTSRRALRSRGLERVS